jgi:hypothetical protein
MAQPVWTLSVDLQTKTATFQSGLADAAKAARSSFTEIKDGANEMGRETGYSMTEARHSVMLLGEEFGIHLPRALTSFIAGLGPIGTALQAAFPFLAIAAGVTLLIEHLEKMKSAAEQIGEKAAAWQKLTDANEEYGDSLRVTNERLKQELAALNGGMTNSLAMALKEASVQADQLAGHLQEDLDKAMKLVEGQQVNLWSKLLNTQGSTDVTDKLRADFDAAKQVIERGKEQIRQASESGNASAVQSAETEARVNAQKSFGDMIVWVGHQLDDASAKQQKYNAESTADKILPTSLAYSDQSQRIAVLKGALSGLHQEYDNTTLAFSNEQLKIKLEGAKEAKAQIIDLIGIVGPYTAMRQKMVEADEKAGEERMRMETAVSAFLAQEYQKQLEQQHDASTRANNEAAKDAESMRNVSKIETTGAASAYIISKQQEQIELRAILQKEQTDLTAAHQREISEQQSFISQMQAMAGQTSDSDKKSKYLTSATNAQTQLTAATRQYNEEMAKNQAAIQSSELETAKLNNAWSVFFSQAHQETLTLAATIRGELQSAMTQTTNGFAQGLAKCIVEGKSMGKEMMSVARQMSESMIEGLIRWGIQDLITKMGMKATASQLAGANATASMAGAPFPLDTSAPAFGASMMGTALAFEFGGIVPGAGRGDIVPAMLTPGEAVLPKALTESLTHAARTGHMGGGGEVHVHNHFSPQIHAIDTDGVEKMLNEHHETFANHFTDHVRKQNH